MPAADHPWYGPRGKLKTPRRTLSDSLRDEELQRLEMQELRHFRLDDEDVRSTRDLSYAAVSDGATMRKPVRYE